jgi:kinesin family protein 4/21/27
VSVSSFKEMATCLEQGSLSRATGSTNMNNQSRYSTDLTISISRY